MATDNLTLKFKEELEKRSKTQLPSVNRSMSPTGGTLWDGNLLIHGHLVLLV